MICEYGCGREAKFQFKNGKWCCSSHHKKCLKLRKDQEGKMLGSTLSVETRIKQSKAKKGRKRPPFSEDWKKKLSLSKKGNEEVKQQLCKARRLIESPSIPQIKIFEMIKHLFPTSKINFPFLNYSLDIAIPEYKLVIEYDGGYWHQDKEKDLKRQKEIEKCGWKFIRYKGTLKEDIIPSLDLLRKDLETAIFI